MNTKQETTFLGHPIVYVRSVATGTLPDEIREAVEAQGAKRLYTIHNDKGQVVGAAPDRKMAFLLARQNDLTPVSVH